MGLLDGLLGTAAYQRAPVPVEGAVGRWTASRLLAGLAAAGGEVILTRDHLVFTPWDMTKTREFLVKLLGAAGVPHVSDIDKLLTASKLLEPVAIWLSQVAAVQPMGRASVTRPPWARISFVDGRHLDLAILAGVGFPNFHPANDAAFDDWLAASQALLLGRAAAPTPTPTPLSTAEPDVDFGALRSQAMSSGTPITVASEGNMRMYITPDGIGRVAIGTRTPRPVGASVAPNLVGPWRSDGFGPHEVVLLGADGAVTGQQQFFAALPPLQILNGTWWMEGASLVTVRFDFSVPEFHDEFFSYFEFGGTLRLTYLGREVAVAEWLDPDAGGPDELTMRRATQTPLGTWR